MVVGMKSGILMGMSPVQGFFFSKSMPYSVGYLVITVPSTATFLANESTSWILLTPALPWQ